MRKMWLVKQPIALLWRDGAYYEFRVSKIYFRKPEGNGKEFEIELRGRWSDRTPEEREVFIKLSVRKKFWLNAPLVDRLLSELAGHQQSLSRVKPARTRRQKVSQIRISATAVGNGKGSPSLSRPGEVVEEMPILITSEGAAAIEAVTLH